MQTVGWVFGLGLAFNDCDYVDDGNCSNVTFVIKALLFFFKTHESKYSAAATATLRTASASQMFWADLPTAAAVGTAISSRAFSTSAAV